MSGRVSVYGAGVGSLTVASLLSRQGWHVVLLDAPRRPPPALVLNQVAQDLLADVFGPELLEDGHVIEERRVRWGSGSREAVVPAGSVSIEGQILLDRLRARLDLEATPGSDDSPSWVVDGAGRAGTEEGLAATRRASRTVFGRRCVLQAHVSLVGDSRSSRVEAVEDGWVHLAPLAVDRAVVQAMLPAAPADPEAALRVMTSATAAVRHAIGGWLGDVTVFSAAPSLSDVVCGPGWISVADAAVSVDPISGFGTAWALRGGILGAAVIEATRSRLPEEECLQHYSDRLRAAVIDHVDRCLDLYGAAFSTLAWTEELQRMASARHAHRQRHPPARFGYRLNGFRLERQQEGPSQQALADAHRAP